MKFPANATVVIVGVIEVGSDDGTPIYEATESGPYRCWFGSMSPEEVHASELIGRVNEYGKVYMIPGPEIGISDRLRVTVDGSEDSETFEVVTVRDRYGASGLDHLEVLCRRVVEGR